jgi:hypothetical protein
VALLLAGSPCIIAGSLVAIDADDTIAVRQLGNAPPDVVAWAGLKAGCQRELSVRIFDEATDAATIDVFGTVNCESLDAERAVLHRKYRVSPFALGTLDAADPLLR